MKKYAKKFASHNIITAQVLVTAANLNKSGDIKRVKNTVDTLLSEGVLPIVNENDATATEELVVGDNDQLSAYITNHINADTLVILSDIDAYYDDDPRQNQNAKVLKIVNKIDENELKKQATPNNVFATGGIVTKLKAADLVMKHNKSMFLASGFDLSDVKSFMLEAKHIGGTLFTSKGIK